MKTQRDIFWDTIYELAKNDRDLIVISADMGAPSLDKFRRDFPAQFINTGIAEQNSILVASGLAKEGKKVFVYAIASFLTLNCIEKIRVQNGMMNIPINLVGVGGGFSYPDSGPTHHLLEDLSIMRAIPNMTTYMVTDGIMSRELAKKYKSFTSSTYIRLERQAHEDYYQERTVDFDLGFTLLGKGSKKLLISNGHMLDKGIRLIRENNLNCGVLDLFRLPSNTAEFIKVVSQYEEIVTLEETFIQGGLGTAVLEVLSDARVTIPVTRLGADNKLGFCYKYGGREELHNYYNLGQSKILEALV